MTLARQRLRDTLVAVAEARATPAQSAELEQGLLAEIMTSGVDPVADKLRRLDIGLEIDGDPASPLLTLRSDAFAPALLVELYASEDLASVQVRCAPADDGAAEDPRHAWFYEAWEALAGNTDDCRLATLGDADRAVYHIALLESEIMNGGFGQYLANTEGHYLDDTIDCLERIGATGTGQLLTDAIALARPGESWDDVWERCGATLDALDDAFLDGSEDLAALVAECYRTDLD